MMFCPSGGRFFSEICPLSSGSPVTLLMLQCFAAFVNLADPTPGADPLVTALEEIDVFKRMMEQYFDRIAPVYRPEDIRKNAEAGKISGMLTIEEAGCCKGSLGVLRRMYELGVRMMTLTWNHENELASPNVVPGNGPIWPCMPNTETGLQKLKKRKTTRVKRRS